MVPMVPLAPALFTTTTDWPSTLPISSPSTRASTSVVPPAPKGTTMLSGREGKACAAACSGAAASSAGGNDCG